MVIVVLLNEITILIFHSLFLLTLTVTTVIRGMCRFLQDAQPFFLVTSICPDNGRVIKDILQTLPMPPIECRLLIFDSSIDWQVDEF